MLERRTYVMYGHITPQGPWRAKAMRSLQALVCQLPQKSSEKATGTKASLKTDEHE